MKKDNCNTECNSSVQIEKIIRKIISTKNAVKDLKDIEDQLKDKFGISEVRYTNLLDKFIQDPILYFSKKIKINSNFSLGKIERYLKESKKNQ